MVKLSKRKSYYRPDDQETCERLSVLAQYPYYCAKNSHLLAVNRPTAVACLSISIEMDTMVETASTMLVATKTASFDSNMFANLQEAVRKVT